VPDVRPLEGRLTEGKTDVAKELAGVDSVGEVHNRVWSILLGVRL
jgi:hypothetical protein